MYADPKNFTVHRTKLSSPLKGLYVGCTRYPEAKIGMLDLAGGCQYRPIGHTRSCILSPVYQFLLLYDATGI